MIKQNRNRIYGNIEGVQTVKMITDDLVSSPFLPLYQIIRSILDISMSFSVLLPAGPCPAEQLLRWPVAGTRLLTLPRATPAHQAREKQRHAT